jgi:DNA-binding IclR family transcriptional regulator
MVAQVVDRALDLLLAVVGGNGPVTLTEAVGATGIDKSTAQRLLTSLVDRGFLARDEVTRRYDVGPAMFGMAAAVSARSNLRRLANPHLVELRDLSGETSSLHLLVGERRVCLDGAESPHPVRRVVPLGESIPAHVGPSGKVLLAHLDPAGRERIYAAAGCGPRERAELERITERVRADEYLHTESDRTSGVRAVSAAIFDGRGVVASITVAGPSSRWDAASASALSGAVKDAAAAISSKLGAFR